MLQEVSAAIIFIDCPGSPDDQGQMVEPTETANNWPVFCFQENGCGRLKDNWPEGELREAPACLRARGVEDQP